MALSFLLAELNIVEYEQFPIKAETSQSVRGVLLCNCVIVTFLLMLVTTTQTLNLIKICLTLLLFLHFVATILKTYLLTEGPESQIDINVSDVQKPLETIKM